MRECLDGFLMQKTNFPVEILIHDDASTDGTKEIIEEYVANYPELIYPIYQTENQYSKGIRGMMARYNFPRAKGKYIAICEGDDYWTNPHKLQKQVDFLEKNPDYSICFHPVMILNNEKFTDENVIQVNETTTITDLAKGNYIHTPSVMFRADNVKDLPEGFLRLPAGDYGIHLLNAQYGMIKKLTDTMAVYRMHDGGMWSGQQHLKTKKKWLLQLTLLHTIIEHEEAKHIIRKELVKNLLKFEDFSHEILDEFNSSKYLQELNSILVRELESEISFSRNDPAYISSHVKFTVLLKALLRKLFRTKNK